MPEVLRRLSCLAEVRGTSDAPALRSAVALLDALPHGSLDTLLRRFRSGDATAFAELPPPAGRALADAASLEPEAALGAARSRIPFLLRRLLELDAVTHDQASHLVSDLGILTVPDLQGALEDGRVKGLPVGTAERLAAAAPTIAGELRPIPLGRALDITELAQQILSSACPAIDEITIAGDVRRFEPVVDTLVIVARTSDPRRALDELAIAPGVDDVLHRSGRRAIIAVQYAEIDVRLAAPDDAGTVLVSATGSAAHVKAVSGVRRRLDLCARESDVYARAGLPWIPPEMRNGTGEIEAASTGRLPVLVERSDIRGDLHMHSTYSDGQDTMEEMVAAAAALGYEYIAITDHSERASASRTVTPDGLKRQREEIERLKERFPGLRILQGVEVEIMPDGRLDFPDSVLEDLDIVLASLHDSANHDGAGLTRRCVRAIRHPLVNIICHPANQLVGRRDGYPLDYDAIYAAAAETGTALEIDGAPSHLDLDGEHARAAVAAGVTVTIDSDCHRARALDRQMRLGIGTARRGWVEARHVLNARSLADVSAFVQAKRARAR